MVAFLPENYTLPNEIRAFLVFEGTQQRQVTEAKISIEDNALHAVIPGKFFSLTVIFPQFVLKR